MRIQLQIFIGILLTVFTLGILVFAGINENNRMQVWSEEAQARSIEQGAAMFESACSGCRAAGFRGSGVMPAAER